MPLLPDILDLTQSLIRIPSAHSRPSEIMRCADFIMNWCALNGLHAHKIIQNDTPSILVLPDEPVRLLLMTHFDVVEAPEELFTPRLDGDRLFGRGALDDKYAVALSLIIFRNRLQALAATGKTQSDMALGLLMTGDEETGGENGAGHALKMIRADHALALDGGSPERIVIREKGVIDIRLTATGTAAHGARPWLGRNAIDIILDDCARLRALFPNHDDHDVDHWHRTINLGRIQGGASINQVPGTAQAWFNIRYTENDDPQALVAAMADRVSSTLDVLSVIPVFAAPPSTLTDSLLRLSPGTVLTKEHGASDARYLMDHGIHGAIWGAQGFGSAHGTEECVSIPSIGHIARVIDALAHEVEQP
ncbi:MAG: M20 family peptidase [Deltaproteobacteria bacterium]|nr:M20 family peptidase [Deltaproteobacteria bacterium]